MTLRIASPGDAAAIAAIYAPIVENTIISFELEPPSLDEMRRRITTTLDTLPWLVHLDAAGAINGYVYASKHRERAAYQWAVDVTAYVRADSRGQGIGARLYRVLFDELVALGYFQACAGITQPNLASVALHEAVGFKPIAMFHAVGYKLGAWHDVGWWQRELQPLAPPAPLRAYARGALSTLRER